MAASYIDALIQFEEMYEFYNLIEFLDKINRKERILKDRENLLESYDDANFKDRFHLSKQTVINVLLMIQDELTFLTNRNKPLSPLFQLFLTLRYFATGSFQLVIGDLNSVSQGAVSYTIHKVAREIAKLLPIKIKFPETQEEKRKTIASFKNIANFPCVIGAIDCTHIPIQSPGGDNAELFRNRKHYFSLNVQVIGDANLKIVDIVAKWQGSVHDSTIFNNSKTRYKIESGQLEGILLGDNGYPNRSYLLTPLLNPISRSEKMYNRSHIKTRNCVERLFGVWKRRFPCLHLGFRVKLKNVTPIIIATAVLHNFAIDASEDCNFIDLQTDFEDIPALNHDSSKNTSAVRQQFIHQYFSK